MEELACLGYMIVKVLELAETASSSIEGGIGGDEGVLAVAVDGEDDAADGYFDNVAGAVDQEDSSCLELDKTEKKAEEIVQVTDCFLLIASLDSSD